MSERGPASNSRYSGFRGKSRKIISKQTDQIDEEGEALKEIERIDVYAAIQEAIRLKREANAEQDVLRKAEKSNIAKNALEAANKKVKEVQGVEFKQGNRVKHFLRACLEDNNLKGFYDNTSFVLKSGSIEDLEKTASLWNAALKERHSIHDRKGIILTDINWDSGMFGIVEDQEQSTEKQLKDFEKEAINDSAYNAAKKELQTAFTGQAKLKEEIVSARRNRNDAAREHEQGGHR